MVVVLNSHHIHKHFAQQLSLQSVDVLRKTVPHIDHCLLVINVSEFDEGRVRNTRLRHLNSQVGIVERRVGHWQGPVVVIQDITQVRNLSVVVKKVPENEKNRKKLNKITHESNTRRDKHNLR